MLLILKDKAPYSLGSIADRIIFMTAPKSTDVRPTSTPRPRRQLSAVTTGKRIFVRGDGRSPWTRRWRDLIEAHASDLGGAGTPSVAQRSLIRRAATLEVELEAIEGRLSEGKGADLAAFAAVTGRLPAS